MLIRHPTVHDWNPPETNLFVVAKSTLQCEVVFRNPFLVTVVVLGLKNGFRFICLLDTRDQIGLNLYACFTRKRIPISGRDLNVTTPAPWFRLLDSKLLLVFQCKPFLQSNVYTLVQKD